MKNQYITIFILALMAFTLTANVPAEASGSYRARLPQPKNEKIDRALYALGQQIFEGKIKIPQEQAGDKEEQARHLGALQKKLPKRVAKSKNLPLFAGRLTAPQMKAIKYYVLHRFGK